MEIISQYPNSAYKHLHRLQDMELIKKKDYQLKINETEKTGDYIVTKKIVGLDEAGRQ